MNSFPHFIGYLFTFLIMSSNINTKFLVFIQSNSFIFVVVACAFHVISKNPLLNLRLLRYTFMFSKTCVILALICRLWIHFKLILYIMRSREQFHFFVSGYASTICWRECPFSHWMIFLSLLKTNWPQMYGFISGISILLHWSMCLFFHTVLVTVGL